ncbi:LysM peptidoglycan-binding domain-containing protein [Candidatus Uabimicrobium amorphum]|nr:LysM peptidoglycan-binding domain-containing protein [Candidatus Uabimicrobium amorphum]
MNIFLDFVCDAEPSVSQRDVSVQENVVEVAVKHQVLPQNNKIHVADKIQVTKKLSDAKLKQEPLKKNVAFDVTQDNKKVFLALTSETTKKETVAHTTKEESAKKEAVKKVVAKKVVAKKEVVKKETSKREKATVEKETTVYEKYEKFHIVSLGDNLWNISKRYYKKTSYQDIQRCVFALAGANPHIHDIDKLNIDTQLFIPLASRVNLYYKKYLYQIQLSRQMMSSKKITKAE